MRAVCVVMEQGNTVFIVIQDRSIPLRIELVDSMELVERLSKRKWKFALKLVFNCHNHKQLTRPIN